jgi:hypothetical protein
VVIFLVRLIDTDPAAGPVSLTAIASDASVTLSSEQIRAGLIVEASVTPYGVETDSTVLVILKGERLGVRDRVERTLPVVPMTVDREADALKIRDLFLPWLIREHPEFGITAGTKWTGALSGAQLLVVSHYLYFSPEWELGVEWHVMIAPYDWANVYLRHRFTEIAPSFGARIDSVSDSTPVHEVPPPAEVRR